MTSGAGTTAVATIDAATDAEPGAGLLMSRGSVEDPVTGPIAPDFVVGKSSALDELPDWA